MNSLIVVISLLSAVCPFAFTADVEPQYVDYRTELLNKIVDPKECTKTGLMCKICSKIVECVKDGDEWIEHNVVDCVIPKYCTQAAGIATCDTTPNPLCDGSSTLVPFQCSGAAAIYPDQFYCDKFHVCGSTHCGAFTCEEGWTYNSKTTYCDIKREDALHCDLEAMDFPVPLCESPGKSGALDENKTIYYVCEVYIGLYLYPFLYMCSNGGQFENGECTIA